MWFSDLEKALKVFREKCPECETFEGLEGNIYGDFIIRVTGNTIYLITHETFKIYRHERKGDDNKWVRV